VFYSKERSRYGEDYRPRMHYTPRTSVKQYEDKSRKQTKSFERTRNVRPRNFFAKLVDSNATKEPNFSKSLEELMDSPGEYIGYWGDSLCCSADAKTLPFEEYEHVEDEVALPGDYDAYDSASDSSMK